MTLMGAKTFSLAYQVLEAEIEAIFRLFYWLMSTFLRPSDIGPIAKQSFNPHLSVHAYTQELAFVKLGRNTITAN